MTIDYHSPPVPNCPFGKAKSFQSSTTISRTFLRWLFQFLVQTTSSS